MSDETVQPLGELALKTLAMPGDTNPSGDIFGGWILSQMDIAGAIVVTDRARGRVATVGVEAMSFHRPVHVGDVVCCHTTFTNIGSTSMTVLVEVWAYRRGNPQKVAKVTEGSFTYVALDDRGKKRRVPKG